MRMQSVRWSENIAATSLILVVMTGSALAGAYADGKTAGNAAAQSALTGTDWQLTALRSADGAALDVVSPAILTVGKDRIGGTDACNNIDGPATFDPSEIHIGDLAMDATRREARIGDRVLDLRTQEFELLFILAGPVCASVGTTNEYS